MSSVADVEALFALHHDRILRYLSRTVRHSDAARDLTQDVFLRVTRTSPPAREGRAVRAWLFQVARNVAIDYLRREQRQPETTAVDEATRPATQDVSAAVNQALGTLSALDRDVFLMREVGGLGYGEIAVACDLTPDAVRSRIHRARLELRARLEAPIAARSTRPLRTRGEP